MGIIKDMEKALVKAATGKGFQRRTAADAALPDKFERKDGIVFKPEWQDDIVPNKPRKKAEK